MTDPDQEPVADPMTPGEACDPLEVLLFETSPYGTIDAIVQHDQQSIYFFLQPKRAEFSPRACWVRNLVPGPYVMNQDDLLAGRQVVLPRSYAKFMQSGRLPRPDELSVVWFEEGNGAALIEYSSAPSDSTSSVSTTSDFDRSTSGDSTSSDSFTEQRILAIIPPWSGQDGFHGYAADCAMDSPVCWPLPKNPRLQQRVEMAADFWSSFLQPPDPFVELRDRLLVVYQERFSPPHSGMAEQQYFDISGNRFPPRGMMQYQFADRTILITVGMSLCPQPNVELSTPEPQRYRRIELAIELPSVLNQERLAHARQQLAQLAGYPWRNFRWLGLGHTCQFSGVFEGHETVLLTAAPSLPDRLSSAERSMKQNLSEQGEDDKGLKDESIEQRSDEQRSHDQRSDDQGLNDRTVDRGWVDQSSPEVPIELLKFRDDPVSLIWLGIAK